MMTHEARERDMRAALAAIDRLPVVAGHHDDPGRRRAGMSGRAATP